MNICLFESKFLTQALELLRRSDSTPRTTETWLNNHITAIMAFDGPKAIGLIPFEPRDIVMGPGKVLKALWVTGAHVDLEYRSKGIGSQMDQKISEFFPQAHAVFAYRADEGSRAYQWYRRMGYSDVCSILAFKKDVQSNAASNCAYHIYGTLSQWQSLHPHLLDLFNRSTVSVAGFVRRDERSWTEKMVFHYYKDHYAFSCLTLEHQGKIVAYAWLGRTAMRDEVNRLDILEIVYTSEEEQRNLLNCIEAFALTQQVLEVRIQLSSEDPLINVVQVNGFSLRWKTNVIGKMLRPTVYLQDLIRQSHSATHYKVKWSTPEEQGQWCGQGKQPIVLLSKEAVRQSFLLGRSDLIALCANGEVAIEQGDTTAIQQLANVSPRMMWKYFQSEYI